MDILIENNITKRKVLRAFPGSLVVKTLHLHCTGSISGQRIETPHAVWPGQGKKEKKDNIP